MLGARKVEQKGEDRRLSIAGEHHQAAPGQVGAGDVIHGARARADENVDSVARHFGADSREAGSPVEMDVHGASQVAPADRRTLWRAVAFGNS